MSIVITHNYRDSLCRTDPLKGKSCIQKKALFERKDLGNTLWTVDTLYTDRIYCTYSTETCILWECKRQTDWYFL